VYVGAGDVAVAAESAKDGRFLVHVLEPDAAKADAAIRAIRASGIYGQVWVEHHTDKRLPYAENLVNILVIQDLARTDVPLAEAMRVLCPGGKAYIVGGLSLDSAMLIRWLHGPAREQVGTMAYSPLWASFRKIRPSEMDDWGHPRHGPDGNAVSGDTLVGPPARVRWVAGPMQEVSNIVTAGGRFYHAGLIARDAYNGLRLWDCKLTPTPVRLGYPAMAVKGSVLPVATRDRLYVVTDGKLQALDGASGKVVSVYADAGTPAEVLCIDQMLVTCDAGTVRAVSAGTTRLVWSRDALLPVGLVAGDGGVYFYEGEGASRAVVKLDLATGKPAWRQDAYPWAAKARRLSYNKGLLVCEVSTFTNDRPGNGIHVLDARDGRELWQRLYEPGQNHYQQGRALQTASRLWILTNGLWEGLDPASGTTQVSYRAGPNHCFPPVATLRFLLGEEMSFTDMATGAVVANRITKGACGREAGLIPANGLVYAAPKHCSCYPMLKCFTALAPAKPGPSAAARAPAPADFAAERGPAYGKAAWPAHYSGPPAATAGSPAIASATAGWPSYRADAARSASTAEAVPADLQVLWTAEIGDWPKVALLRDWQENPYVRGPITPPVAAGGLVVVAQGDGHRVAAIRADTGKMLWDFTANGRIDTPPTLTGGLCLFGTRSGWLYALRASDGQLAWRLRIAPEEERIVAFGQLESPWPVPGSVLVAGGTAYIAAGRHPLADGGVRVLALDPTRGAVKWAKTVTKLPMQNFYGGAGLEFDPFDLLAVEMSSPAQDGGNPRDVIAMSRWQFDPATGESAVVWESGFALCRAGSGSAMVPRGLWTYGQRMDYLASGPKAGEPDAVGAKLRPLAAFRDGAIFAASEDGRCLSRRDFTAESIASFDTKWFSQRSLPRKDKPGDRDRHERLARGAAWTVETFAGSDRAQGIGAVVVAEDKVFVAGTGGGLVVLGAADGKKLAAIDIPAPIWDGVAAAGGCLYVSTRDGRVICLGKK
jgi:outer membrane protein assembly factor BamB